MNKEVKYSVIVPVFNEELVVKETYKRLKAVMDATDQEYEIIFVNDGSVDNTAEILVEICKADNKIKLIDFSRNFGHQISITAGMDYSLGQAIIVIDADLQDPPEIILEMIKKWEEGYEVVYGKRLKRNGETLFKKLTAKGFYRILKSMTSVNIPVDTGDFRLIDRKVCDILKRLPERSRYVRGLISWIGFRQVGVEFVREERFAGKTKYPLKKMIKFASDAITSFSYKPLKLATYLGLALSTLSFLYLLWVIYEKLFTNFTQPGWASIIAVNLFFNGIILLMLGTIGEYIGRIYEETKGRPLYIVSRQIGFFKNEKDNNI
ncbi:dolichol-phosphate mannosyltransferase [Anaerobacterium chartisolvens]|uniref:Dolichol-phosphate mannosyltransferase n=1 Tax=Anaerobacterium chartisolvens TaxID=1297424 RepID=A0A369BGP3_9FIRM|nr:glycosyltransferase family 2 protein [Anaerobacterium chartisolvens]RCX18854.1 dolichol-phosphate mannosyltransferase [Anaerobacterium chartisolvens]